MSAERYARPPNDTARVIEVIETTLTRRGSGVDGDPIRVVTEYRSLDGRLLAEVDDFPPRVPLGGTP